MLGHILFAQEDTLMARTFDVETRKLGPEEQILDDILTDRSELFAEFAVSKTGQLVYLKGASERVGYLTKLRQGPGPERLHDAPRAFDYQPLSLSPTGERVAVAENDLMVHVIENGIPTQVTDHPLWDWYPIWNQAGNEITFVSVRGGSSGLYSRSANGTGLVNTLVENEFHKWPGGWHPDGKELIYTEEHAETDDDLMIYNSETENPVEFLGGPGNQNFAEFSPDGKWVVYMSDQDGVSRIWLTSYPKTNDSTPLPVSGENGGNYPRWSPDNKKIFYQLGAQVMTVELPPEMDNSTKLPPPENFIQGVDTNGTWDVGFDGDYYVVALEKRPVPRLQLVMDIFADLLKER